MSVLPCSMRAMPQPGCRALLIAEKVSFHCLETLLALKQYLHSARAVWSSVDQDATMSCERPTGQKKPVPGNPVLGSDYVGQYSITPGFVNIFPKELEHS
ncbi:hypothetical protein PMIN06_012312 [Paraphaeosphaeria minitans]